MPPIIPGPNDTSNQPDWLQALLRAFPQLAPQQAPRSLSAPGQPSGGGLPPWMQPLAQRAASFMGGQPNLQTSSPGGGQQTPTSWEEAALQEFLRELSAPLDFNDPRVASILRQSQGATEREAQARGIQGGLALSGQQQAYINAAAQLDAARQQQRGSLLNAAANRGLQRNEMDYNRFLQEQERSTDPWRTAGGVLGGAGGLGLGIGASLLTGGAALPLVPGLVSGGSQIGAGLGGQAYGAFNPQQRRPSYGSQTPRLY